MYRILNAIRSEFTCFMQLPTVVPARAQSSCSCHEVGGGGGRAGQELCYLCHQRSRRNQPVSFEEERRRREDEENRMLDAFHRMKVAEFRLQQEVRTHLIHFMHCIKIIIRINES